MSCPVKSRARRAESVVSMALVLLDMGGFYHNDPLGYLQYRRTETCGVFGLQLLSGLWIETPQVLISSN